MAPQLRLVHGPPPAEPSAADVQAATRLAADALEDLAELMPEWDALERGVTMLASALRLRGVA